MATNKENTTGIFGRRSGDTIWERRVRIFNRLMWKVIILVDNPNNGFLFDSSLNIRF
jgi:hypothetical protein